MAKRTKEEALETRNLILDTSEILFAEKGVSKTTLNDIAKAAGLTRGAIYWHFENKADLFHAMLKRVTLPMDEFPEALNLDPNTPILEYMLARSLHVVRLLADNPRTQRVFDIVIHKAELVDDMLPIRDQHLECRQKCLTRIEDDIRNAIEKKELPEHIDAHSAAIGFHSLIDGLFCNWVLNPAGFDLPKHTEHALSSYLLGLQHSKPHAPHSLPSTETPAP